MTHRITFTLPDDVHNALSDEAETENRTVSRVIVDALYRGINVEPWSKALDAVRGYMRSGLSDEKALDAVNDMYPFTVTTMKTVRWVRWDLRIARGEDDVPRDREVHSR